MIEGKYIKMLLCATETEYLGYVLTREGIKPQPKKGRGYPRADTATECQAVT